MANIITRNSKVTTILNELYGKALDNKNIIDESKYITNLNKLFSTESWGFREILLVVIVGIKLDSNFKASTGLYDCNPRALYEGPIVEFLIEKNIPHRKSGPLNVAKAAKGLDKSWAAQRRPAEVANAVVNLVNLIETNSGVIDSMGISLIRKLIAESKKVSALAIELEPTADPDFLFEISSTLIKEAPDSGNTPQKISGLLLKNLHSSMNDGIVVTGLEDRASVTSTTSKKPGDINEESSDGKIYKVYEITVKPFDLSRIRESFDCVSIYNSSNDEISEIYVICRQEDCPSQMTKSNSSLYLGNYSYNNLKYYFIDIYEWICMKLIDMTIEGRKSYYNELNNYINDINTSKAVKIKWQELHK